MTEEYRNVYWLSILAEDIMRQAEYLALEGLDFEMSASKDRCGAREYSLDVTIENGDFRFAEVINDQAERSFLITDKAAGTEIEIFTANDLSDHRVSIGGTEADAVDAAMALRRIRKKVSDAFDRAQNGA